MKFHNLPFHCDTCGKNGTILEIACSSEGSIGISGLCVLCGKEMAVTYSMVKVIAACAQLDSHTPPQEDKYIQMLDNFHPTGKAN